jgi:hypothetical protein
MGKDPDPDPGDLKSRIRTKIVWIRNTEFHTATAFKFYLAETTNKPIA